MSSNLLHIEVNNQWQNVYNGEDVYTIRNPSGFPVVIYLSESEDIPNDELVFNSLDYIILGGVFKKIRSIENINIWAKCLVEDEVAEIMLIRLGTPDPDDDLSGVIENLTITTENLIELTENFNTHEDDKNNPHSVTYEQTGASAVDHIHDPKDINAADREHTHIPDEVGLGNVPNYGIATDNEALDSTNTTSFMTPAAVAKAINFHSEAGFFFKPDLIVKSKMGIRFPGWLSFDSNLPTLIIEKESDTSIRVNKDLQVIFSNDSKAMLSKILTNDLILDLSSVDNDNCYIYSDIDINNEIISIGFNNAPLTYGIYRENYLGDFYNTTLNLMYDHNDKLVKRVYLGKVIVENNTITSISNIPLGDRHILPITDTFVTGQRSIIQNPFITAPINVKLEVLYNACWAETYWDDQIGMKATWLTSSPQDIVVQCGRMGFLISGSKSGCAHGDNFSTIIDFNQLKARLIITKI